MFLFFLLVVHNLTAGEHLDVPQDVVQDETGDETPVLPKPMSREYYVCFLCEVDNDHSLGLYQPNNFHITTIHS